MGTTRGWTSSRAVLQSKIHYNPVFAWISIPDLWILTAYVFMELSGGPVIPFAPGRSSTKAKLHYHYQENRFTMRLFF